MVRIASLALLGAFGLAGCAASPLYKSNQLAVTPGEVPRDGRGEPVWSMIPPIPEGAYVPPSRLAEMQAKGGPALVQRRVSGAAQPVQPAAENKQK
jgi:hypothetical protein